MQPKSFFQQKRHSDESTEPSVFFFFLMLSRIEIEDSEAVGISNIISNLITMFPRSTLMALPSELFTSFINCLTLLTCSFGRSAALEEVVGISSPEVNRWLHSESKSWSMDEEVFIVAVCYMVLSLEV